MDELLVNVKEAARRLSLGRSVVYELLASGQIQSVKVGRRRLVPIQELRAWVDRQLAASTAALAVSDTKTRP